MDTAHANALEGKSYIGCAVLARGPDEKDSGAISWSTKAPSFHADSTGCMEVYAASHGYKIALGNRMLIHDLTYLGLPIPPQLPTPLYTDATVVSDGVETGRLTKMTRWISSRFGMLDNGVKSGAIQIRKVNTKYNCSDILNEPIVGPTFDLHRVTLLGLAHISVETLSSLSDDLRSRVEPYLSPSANTKPPIINIPRVHRLTRNQRKTQSSDTTSGTTQSSETPSGTNAKDKPGQSSGTPQEREKDILVQSGGTTTSNRMARSSETTSGPRVPKIQCSPQEDREMDTMVQCGGINTKDKQVQSGPPTVRKNKTTKSSHGDEQRMDHAVETRARNPSTATQGQHVHKSKK